MIIKHPLFTFSLCVLSCVTIGSPQLDAEPPQRNAIIALANDSIKTAEPKLQPEDTATLREYRQLLKNNKDSDTQFDEILSAQVSILTLSIATQKSRNGILAAASELVLLRSENIRVLNLFGAILHTCEKYSEAALVYEYAHSLDPKNPDLRLNLASTYLDCNRDKDAKPHLDILEKDDPENKGVFLALATYWERQGNKARAAEYARKAVDICLIQAASHKAEEKNEETEFEEITDEPDETLEEHEQKIEKLYQYACEQNASPPPPGLPPEMRKTYSKMPLGTKFRQPNTPGINLQGPREFKTNKPILQTWLTELDTWLIKMQPTGRRSYQSVIEKQMQSLTPDKMGARLQQAHDIMKQYQGMGLPDLSPAEFGDALTQIENVANKIGTPLNKNNSPSQSSVAPFQAGSFTINTSIPAGYFFATKTCHDEYMTRLMVYHMKELESNFKDHGMRRVKEEANHIKIKADHEKKGHDRSGPGCIPCLRERIRHAKAMNEISSLYYKNWSNIYFPFYTKKLKPFVEKYYYTCMSMLKDLPSQEEVDSAYAQLMNSVRQYSSWSAGHIMTGDFYEYYPPTDEDEALLKQLIALAEMEAKNPEGTGRVGIEFTDWFADNLAIGGNVSVPGVAQIEVKATARSVEFGAHVLLVGGGANYDWHKDTFSSNFGVGVKQELKISSVGKGVSIGGEYDFWRQTSTWDFKNGTYLESYTRGASVSGKVGDFSVAVKADLDGKIVSKTSVEIGYGDKVSAGLKLAEIDRTK